MGLIVHAGGYHSVHKRPELFSRLHGHLLMQMPLFSITPLIDEFAARRMQRYC